MSKRRSRNEPESSEREPIVPLEEAKRAVSAVLLGRQGVHGVGLRRETPAVVLYIEPTDARAIAALRATATPLAAPFPVEFVQSERAKSGGATD